MHINDNYNTILKKEKPKYGQATENEVNGKTI